MINFEEELKNFQPSLEVEEAESAIYNGCTFISTDNRVIRIVNKYFQNRAIHYDDFIREVQVLR